MQPSRLEYSLLQAILSPIGGDRITLALVHWDGRQLRHAVRTRVPTELEDARAAARRALRAIDRAVEALPANSLDFGLDVLLPARVGDATGLTWTPVHVGHTRSPERHFGEMVDALRLAPVVQPIERELTQRKIDRDLHDLGSTLRRDPSIADRIAIDAVVRGFDEYCSPLSWRNGGWRHALGVTLPTVDDRKINDVLRRVAGILDVAIPRDATLVVVFPDPELPAVRDQLLEGVGYLRDNAGVDRIEAICLPVADAHLYTAELERRVRVDLAH